ncbi:MAG: membrane lipoprotein lipid attachment site-containing protein [Oscillospiraceae bacterium]
MKKLLLIILATAMLTGCTAKPTSDEKVTTPTEISECTIVSTSAETSITNTKKELTDAVKEFNWSSYDEKPFLYENIFAHECRVFVCDIDEDKIPEILLTEIYSPREANATEILKFENGEYVSAYGFWGNCYSAENDMMLYENPEKENILIFTTSSYHGGTENTVVSEVNVSSFSYKVLYGKTTYDNGKEKNFWINEDAEISRDFIDSGFSGYKETDKKDFEIFLNEYNDTLTPKHKISVYDCGLLSLENLPTSDMLIDEDFNYNEYMKNKDSSESIKKSNEIISEKIISKIDEFLKSI